ncbi:Mu transposase C-terminal domain-containing protein [Kitasatospora sp. NPDC028055]|uniref:Mu transposase C-terminal domain-containing protein n=1 Tax=Kitasatospora sp. NPDC028055 TaxID=3155653 RepID=UPI0033D5C34D
MPQSHRIAVEDWIEFEDERHQVVGISGTTVRLRSETGRLQAIMLTEILNDATFRAGIEPPKVNGVHDEDERDVVGALSGLAPAVRDAALELEAHLLEAMTGYRSGSALDALPHEPRDAYRPELPVTERVQAKAEELGRTRRWIFKLWEQRQSQGLWGLVDKRQARVRNSLKNLDPRVIQAIIDQAAAEQMDSTATIGGRFHRRCQNRLNDSYGEGVVVLPLKHTFRRAVAILLGNDMTAPAYRRASAANQPDRTFGTVLATRPGEIVMLDSTPLDVLSYDPETKTTMRVEVTVAIDVATRSILAWRLTPEGTKAIDIGLVLADVMTPEPMRQGWADALRFQMLRLPFDRMASVDDRLTHAAARPVVYPETLMFDHGKPYQSKIVRDACLRWKINIQDARKLKPTDKPQVERLFGTIRTQFSEHVAGYKSFAVAHRGRTAEAQARWTVDEITEFFAEYVVTVYQRQHHRGLHLNGFPDLRISPNEAYEMALGAAGYIDVPRDPDLYFELLPIERRKIHPHGIELNHLVYNADVLYQFRGAKSEDHDGLWPVRYDPRNLLHAYFRHPSDGRWHVLRWTKAQFEHQPFTDITLREAKRLLAVRGQAATDQEAVAAALIELQNRMDAPETWAKDRKRRFRDDTRGRAQTDDLKRSTPPVNDHPPLTVVPGTGTSDVMLDDGIDYASLTPAPTYDPRPE